MRGRENQEEGLWLCPESDTETDYTYHPDYEAQPWVALSNRFQRIRERLDGDSDTYDLWQYRGYKKLRTCGKQINSIVEDLIQVLNPDLD